MCFSKLLRRCLLFISWNNEYIWVSKVYKKFLLGQVILMLMNKWDSSTVHTYLNIQWVTIYMLINSHKNILLNIWWWRETCKKRIGFNIGWMYIWIGTWLTVYYYHSIKAYIRFMQNILYLENGIKISICWHNRYLWIGTKLLSK